jgi:hypothetical protein
MQWYNLSDRDPALHRADREIVAALKAKFPALARDWLRDTSRVAQSAAGPAVTA